MDMPDPTPTEQAAIHIAHDRREECRCGEIHEEGGITSAVIARMMGYLAAHPGHQFAVDEEAGVVAVIAAYDPDGFDPPEILARSDDLTELLDAIDAPSAADLS